MGQIKKTYFLLFLLLLSAASLRAQIITSGGGPGAFTIANYPGNFQTYYDGFSVIYRSNGICSASPTMDIAGMGPKTIVNLAGGGLLAGDIQISQVVTLVYDNAAGNFRMISPSGNAGGGVAGGGTLNFVPKFTPNGTTLGNSLIFDNGFAISINTAGSAPNATALLDVDASPGNNKGLLIPRVALTATNSNTPIGAGMPASLLVYNTATAGGSPNNVIPGYYYWDGAKWISLSGGTGSNNWGLLGNSGTVAGTNFIGTTDAIDLVFKTSSTERFRINNTSFQFLANNAGTAALPIYSFTADANTGIYNAAADQLNFTTAGTERLRITSGGQMQSTKFPAQATPDYSFSGNTGSGMFSPGINDLSFATNGTERLKITNVGQMQSTKFPAQATPDYSFSGNTGSGMFSPGINDLSFATNGTERLKITNVGQMQSTKFPAAATPDYSFSANTGSGMFSPGINDLSFATAGTERLKITNVGQMQSTKAPAAATPDYSFSANTGSGMFSAGINDLSFSTNGTERLKITNAGQMQSTKAPAAATPDYSFVANTSTGMYSSGVNTLNFSAGGIESLRLLGNQALSGNAGSAGFPAWSFTGNTNTGMFNPAGNQLAFSTGGSERVRIDASGNVGIGATIPGSLLHVNGVEQLGTVSATTGQLKFFNAASAFATIFQAGVATAAVTYTLPLADGASGNVLQTNGTGTLSWQSFSAGAWARSAPFVYPTTLSDNVGIGTNTPGAMLDVNGTVKLGSAGTVVTAMIAGTVTVDPPNIAAGGNTTVFVAIAGVAGGDHIFLTPRAGMDPDLAYQGATTVAGGVNIKLRNLATLSATDGAALIWSYWIIKP